MTLEQEDIILRDLLQSSAQQFTEEQMKEIEKQAPWIKLTDDGIEFSQGMKELIQSMFVEEFKRSNEN